MNLLNSFIPTKQKKLNFNASAIIVPNICSIGTEIRKTTSLVEDWHFYWTDCAGPRHDPKTQKISVCTEKCFSPPLPDAA